MNVQPLKIKHTLRRSLIAGAVALITRAPRKLRAEVRQFTLLEMKQARFVPSFRPIPAHVLLYPTIELSHFT